MLRNFFVYEHPMQHTGGELLVIVIIASGTLSNNIEANIVAKDEKLKVVHIVLHPYYE